MINRALLIVIASFTVLFSGIIILKSPNMHKPFQFSVVEYLIKINSDNSMTTTKKVTDYKIEKENK